MNSCQREFQTSMLGRKGLSHFSDYISTSTHHNTFKPPVAINFSDIGREPNTPWVIWIAEGGQWSEKKRAMAPGTPLQPASKQTAVYQRVLGKYAPIMDQSSLLAIFGGIGNAPSLWEFEIPEFVLFMFRFSCGSAVVRAYTKIRDIRVRIRTNERPWLDTWISFVVSVVWSFSTPTSYWKSAIIARLILVQYKLWTSIW